MKKMLFLTLMTLFLTFLLPAPAVAASDMAGILSARPLHDPTAAINQDIVALLDEMAVKCKYNGISYKDSSYEWLIMDMAAYAGFAPADSANSTTAAARQTYIDQAINSLADPQPGPYGSLDSVYAKAVLGLRAMGVDPTNLITLNKAPLNAISLLKSTATTSVYNAPYVLLACQQGDYETLAQEQSLVTFLLQAQLTNGAWGWGDTLDTADPDGTAMAIQGLAKYYADDAEVADAVDKALDFLSKNQAKSGAFVSVWTDDPSADTMAQVILALAALGLDPDTDPRFVKEQSLLAGLLALREGAKDGFFDDSNEQAFRALIAMAGLRRLDMAYNFYDFTAKPTEQGVAASLGDQPTIPATESSTDITVYFTLKGLGGEWISRTGVVIPQDAKVYHVIIKALAAQSYRQSGAESGYIASVTGPIGTTLSEFEHGPNSGWLYKVNGYLPGVGLTSYDVSEGDHVLLYYTKDWTSDPEAGKFSGGGSGSADNPFTDVPQNHWAASYIYDLTKRGVIKGKTLTLFVPEESLSRAELVSLLFSLSGEEAPQADAYFYDTPKTAWYARELAWAVQAGIIDGVGENLFAPLQAVSRQDMAVMLLRYAVSQKIDLSPTEEPHAFIDKTDIGAYAAEAVAALHLAGIITGYEDNSFRPRDNVTRAEAAKLVWCFME